VLFCFFYKHCYPFVFELVFPGFIIRSYLIGFVVSAGPMGPIEVSRWRDQPQTIFFLVMSYHMLMTL
jgi:hypothetical protein